MKHSVRVKLHTKYFKIIFHRYYMQLLDETLSAYYHILHPIYETDHFMKWANICPFQEVTSIFIFPAMITTQDTKCKLISIPKCLHRSQILDIVSLDLMYQTSLFLNCRTQTLACLNQLRNQFMTETGRIQEMSCFRNACMLACKHTLQIYIMRYNHLPLPRSMK